MNGARWGWLALIGAIAVLFAASNQESTLNTKLVQPLRQDLKRLTQERDQALAERNQAQELAAELETWADMLGTSLESAEKDVQQLKAERESLRNEVAKLSLDRGQLQQTILSLQQERAQTKRNVEQLRHGLHQLLSQAEGVTTALAQPAPGVAPATFQQEAKTPVLMPPPAEKYYPDEPLNDNQ